MRSRTLRAPWLHFILIGAALFALTSLPTFSETRHQPTAEPASKVSIEISAASVNDRYEAWREQYGLPPSPEEKATLLRELIDEEILHHEALALGLHRDDQVVRQRMIKLARFLEAEPGRSPDDLEREARRLGLDRSDPIVKRYLVQTMRLLLGRPDPDARSRPTDEEIERRYAENRERFETPGTVRFTHVYLSRERRGQRLDAEARALLDRLRRENVTPEEASVLGDPFIRASNPLAGSSRRLDGIFGQGFAQTIENAPPGSWAGPFASPYGLHLVWVHERRATRPAPLAAVRAQIANEILRDRGEERLERRMEELRGKYRVTVEGTEAPG